MIKDTGYKYDVLFSFWGSEEKKLETPHTAFHAWPHLYHFHFWWLATLDQNKDSFSHQTIFFVKCIFWLFVAKTVSLCCCENHKKFSQKVKKIVSKMIWTGMFESSWHIQESFQNCSKLLWNLRIPKVPQDKWEIVILMTIDVDDGLIHGERNHWIESYHNVWHVTCVTQHDGNMH